MFDIGLTINARYPPPDTAMPIFGNKVALLETRLMYEAASNPDILALERKSIIGCIVSFLRTLSQDVSSCESAEALRTDGGVAGQLTEAGA